MHSSRVSTRASNNTVSAISPAEMDPIATDNAGSQSSIESKKITYAVHGFETEPKSPPQHADENLTSGATDSLRNTKNDRSDMRRMGKTPQLRRNFRQMSAVSLICVLVSTWEVIFLANDQGLVDGGLGGLFWSYVWTFVGFAFVAVSLAEMASMAPTSGGMYHWVSEFAPPRFQSFLSYVTGWMSTLSWQAGNASGAFIAGNVIQAILTVNYPHYNPTNWQGTLFVFATVILVFLVNTFLIRVLPLIQNLLMVVHVWTFLGLIVVFWVLAPHNPAETVFLTLTDGGNWGSIGLSMMIGQITAIYALVGSDTAAHMSEEIRDAGSTVPKAMLWSFCLNGAMGLVFLVTMLFTITNIHDALHDPSGYSAIYMLKQAVGNAHASITGIVTILIVLSLASNFSFTASTSRQTFAFARDGGIPYGAWIAKVHPKLLIPVNAISLTSVIACLLALINIGSDVAFNAIISLFLVALMVTYLISISCVLYRRLTTPLVEDSLDPTRRRSSGLPPARWSLGHKTGIFFNVGAILYCAFAFFWCFWPNANTGGDLTEFNWSVVIFLAVFVLSLVFYVFDGRKNYRAPVCTVIKDVF